MKRQMMTAVAVCALAFAAGCASTPSPAARVQAAMGAVRNEGLNTCVVGR